MIVTRIFIDQVWTDINSPTKEEVDSLILSQNIDPSIAKDLLAPTPKQYAKESGNAIYAVLHIPYFNHSRSINLEQEIDFIITEKSLTTARYDSIDALHYFAKQIEVDQILNKGNYSHLFFGLMKEVYESLFNEIDYIKEWLKEIEKNIFEGHEKQMVFSISAASRNLLSFKRVTDPHKTVLINIANILKNNFGDKFEKDGKSLLEELERLTIEIRNIEDMIDELRETNNSILTTKQNEIMKTLTILAFIVIPLATLSQIFGMNVVHTPLVGLPYDFWILIGIMVAMALAMFGYFKYKKWI